MKASAIVKILIIILIGFIPLGSMEAVLDNTLLPKFLSLSIFLLVIWLFISFKKIQQYKINVIDMALITYLVFHAISIFVAINVGDAIYESLKVGLLVALVLALKQLYISEDQKIYSSIALASLIATVLAIGLSFDEVFSALKLKAPFKDSNYLIKSQFGHKNMFSNWLLFLLPLNFLNLIYNKKLPKIICYLVIAAQLVMIAILMTRAVYIATIAGLLLYVVIQKYNSQKLKSILSFSAYGLGSLLLIFVVLIAFGKLSFVDNLNTQTSNSAVERLVIWTKSIGLVKDHFFFGVGAGNWKILLPSQGIEGMRRALDGTTIFARPHNDFLWVWAEIGIFGFIAFMGFIVLTLRAAFDQLFKTNNKTLLLAFCGFISYLVVSFFDFPKERVESIIVLAVFISIISHESKSNLKSFHLPHLTKKLYPLIFVALSAFCIYFAQIRIESESHMRIALSEKDKGNYKALVEYAYLAEHPFYSADNNGLPVRYYSGIGHFNLNQKENAIVDFKVGYQLNPYNFNVINNIATAYFISNDYSNAEAYYLKALKINPYFDDARLNLAATYINTNQKEKANFYLNQVSQNSERLQQLKALAM